MAIRELDALVKVQKLKIEEGDAFEIEGLLASDAARLRDAMNDALSIESRFDLAYGAAHAFSLAALRWHGYRSENRYVVFQALAHTVKMKPEQWRVLDQAHGRRNRFEYEGSTEVDPKLVESMIRVAQEVERRVRALGPLPAKK